VSRETKVSFVAQVQYGRDASTGQGTAAGGVALTRAAARDGYAWKRHPTISSR
jgi:hypothetical protein